MTLIVGQIEKKLDQTRKVSKYGQTHGVRRLLGLLSLFTYRFCVLTREVNFVPGKITLPRGIKAVAQDVILPKPVKIPRFFGISPSEYKF